MKSVRPFSTDPMDALEERGSVAVGLLNAASAELVGVIADALVCEAWKGFNSPEHWIAVRFGLGPQRAKRYVAAARALAVLPECRAAYGNGELSEDHVAVIVGSQVSPHHDREVLELARNATVGQLRHALKSLPKPPEPEPAKDDEEKPEPRDRASFVSRRWREDGRYEIHGVLDPLMGATVDKAIDAALEKLFRHRTGCHDDDADVTSQARERVSAADALAHALGLALDAMDPATAEHPGRMPSDRYVVNIHLDADNAERIWLHLGPLLPPGLREELLQDALVRIWAHRPDGTIDLGRLRRTADPKLRLAVEWRDGGCTTVGCPNNRGLRMHHVREWENGGPTDYANLTALCPECHRAVHACRYRVIADDHGGFTMTDRDGKPLGYRPPPPPDRTRDRSTGWANRSGERAHWDCLQWSDLPDTG
jgi:hypothetical protein